MERDESDVHKLLETLNGQMLNPFDTNTHRSCFVMNLATGMTSSEEVSKDITTAKEIGEKCNEQFVKSRLVKDAEMCVMDPIRKNKLKTLSFYRTPVKVPTGKLSDRKTIDADRGFPTNRCHTGQCKRTGGCYNELVVAFFSTSGGVKGKKSIPVDFIIYL